MREKLFPTLMIVFAVCAGLFYIPTGDWRKTVYWFAAATLNFAITY